MRALYVIHINSKFNGLKHSISQKFFSALCVHCKQTAWRAQNLAESVRTVHASLHIFMCWPFICFTGKRILLIVDYLNSSQIFCFSANKDSIERLHCYAVDILRRNNVTHELPNHNLKPRKNKMQNVPILSIFKCIQVPITVCNALPAAACCESCRHSTLSFLLIMIKCRSMGKWHTMMLIQFVCTLQCHYNR